MSNDQKGASSNERLLSAAKTDNVELLLEVFNHPDDEFDINFRDGLGNTALHYAAQYGLPEVLEEILTYQGGCDVDLQNLIEGNTPLHAAIKNIEHPGLRNHIVESLLEAGADTKIKDKNGDTPEDCIRPSVSAESDKELRQIIRSAAAQASILDDDIAYDDESDGEPGSGSDED